MREAPKMLPETPSGSAEVARAFELTTGRMMIRPQHRQLEAGRRQLITLVAKESGVVYLHGPKYVL